MIPLLSIVLLLLRLLFYGALLCFSVAAGVTRRPGKMVLFTCCAILPIGIAFLCIPPLIVGGMELSSKAFLPGCLMANLLIHGGSRLFVYLYNH